MSEPSQKQQEVVDCKGHCLVFAGPGSGKSKVLVDKADYTIQTDPGGLILIVTFTKDAARSIRKKVIDRISQRKDHNPRDIDRIASGTFHSVAYSQLKQTGFNGTIISAGQMRQYIKRAKEECRVDMTDEDAQIAIEIAKSTPDYEPSNDDVGKLFIAYERIIKQNNVIDFSDMLSRTLRMMKYENLAPKKCNYLFVDEMQDMDEMQYEWCVEHIKAGAIFTGIGDDDQSIYKFRRALGYGGMKRFSETFGATEIKLDINYRSKSEIVTSAIKVISKNKDRMSKKIIAFRGAGGHVRIYGINLKDYEKGTVEAAEKKELELICNEIKKSLIPITANGVTEYYVRPDEWSVLARNNDQLKTLSEMLRSMQIQHICSLTPIWELTPVCYAIETIKSLIPVRNPNTNEITYPKVGLDSALYYAGIDEKTLRELHEKLGDDFALMMSGDPDFSNYTLGTKSTLSDFAKAYKNWKKAAERKQVHDMPDTRNNAIIGIFDWYLMHLDNNVKSGKGRENIRKMMDTAKSILITMNGSLQERIQIVTRKNPEDKKDSEGNTIFQKDGDGRPIGKIVLSTMHSSKGLEYDNVWMMGLNEGIIPSENEKDDDPLTPEMMEEERRLFYVAMTRARNNLFMSYVGFPSTFISETGINVEHLYIKNPLRSEAENMQVFHVK